MTTSTPPVRVPVQRDRSGAARASRRPLEPWACVNCAQPNAARRRRCVDCGTLRW